MGKIEDIALFDLDGTLCDYDSAIKRDYNRIKSPSDPKYSHEQCESIPYLKERIKIIRSQPGWWRNLKEFKLGFDILKLTRQFGFQPHILTKGPYSSVNAWTEKAEWAREHVPDAGITITEDKGLVYGKILVDDFPGYIERWLEHRPRGVVIMPANEGNKCFKHPSVTRYDGRNLDQIKLALSSAKRR